MSWLKQKLALILAGVVLLPLGAVGAASGCDPLINLSPLLIGEVRPLLEGKTAVERASIKSQKIASLQVCGHHLQEGLDINIKDIKYVDGHVEVFAQAWKDGKQLGFGVDGTVDVERFRIFNPPILLDDPNGPIVLEHTHLITGEVVQRKLREDPRGALIFSLAHAIKLVGRNDSKIVVGKVGNTTSTFYSGSAGDGSVTNSAAASWATVHDATDGSSNDDTSALSYIMGDRKVSTTFYIIKAFLPFDTSAIADTDTISSAILSVWTSSDGGSGGAENMYLVATTQASNTALENADFDQQGVASLKSGGGTFSMDSTTPGTEVDVTLASPDANVSKTSFTKLGIREYDHDVANVEAVNNKYQSIYTAEQTDTANDPTLVVIHAATAVLYNQTTSSIIWWE